MEDVFESLEEISNSLERVLIVLNQHTFQIDEIRSRIHVAEKQHNVFLSLEEKVNQNAKALNSMMLELKGIISQVRPQVKNTGWYGTEVPGVNKRIEDESVKIVPYKPVC